MSEDIVIKPSLGGRDLEKIRDLRYEILRKPLGLTYASTLFSGDDSANTIHLLALAQDELVGVASLLVDGFDSIQLRGMAVALPLQRSGVGKRIVEAAKHIAVEQNRSMWCKSRLEAIGFYERQGWCRSGDFFDIPEIGPHIVMKWTGILKNNP